MSETEKTAKELEEENKKLRKRLSSEGRFVTTREASIKKELSCAKMEIERLKDSSLPADILVLVHDTLNSLAYLKTSMELTSSHLSNFRKSRDGFKVPNQQRKDLECEMLEKNTTLNKQHEVALAELALAKERLGPAGWKILQEYEVYRKALEEIISTRMHSSSCGDLNNPFNNGKMIDGCNCGINELTEIKIARKALSLGTV